MEAFLRAMREVCPFYISSPIRVFSDILTQIERHDKVLHLPAPHIWQLTPYLSRPESLQSLDTYDGPSQSLIVTLELHVPKTLTDDEVLELTSWAWNRCRTALKYGTGDGGGDALAEVTVGVVRG